MKQMDAEKIKAHLAKDKFGQGIGAEIVELTTERAVVNTVVKEDHLNANGVAQGGMIYTIADYAFAALANFLHPATVTQSGRIQYLRPATCGELTFVATETARVGKNCICEVVAKNGTGEIVCVCNFSGFIKEMDIL